MGAEPVQSMSSQNKRLKRKKTHKDPELERLDSLPWNSSIPNDDTLSAFIGSNDLEGGFLSLEEIDEAEYGLVIPEPDTMKHKLIPKASGNSRKGEQNNADNCGDASRDSGDSINKEVAGHNVNMRTSQKGKKEKKKKKKKKKVIHEVPTAEEVVAEDIGGSDNDGIETEIGNEMDDGDPLETGKKRQKKEKETKNHGIEKEIRDDVEKDAVDETEYYAWNELRLHPLLMKSIYKLGFKEPTAIQKACIPAAAYQGKDVVGAAETGSGKTLAFGLPILQRFLDEREKSGKMSEEKGVDAKRYAPRSLLRALIITPTRELALQVTDHLKAVAVGTDIRVVPIVGGMSTEKQERLLRMRPEVVVGTPGRLWELMSGGEKHLVELQTLSFFVLDEADRMIENGHFRELQSIIDMLPVTHGSAENLQNAENSLTSASSQRKKRQTLVFSATLSLSSDFRKKLKRGSSRPNQLGMDGLNSIEALSERAGIRPNVAIINLTNTSVLANNLEESFIECREEDKDAYLYYVLSVYGQGRTIVFCTSIAALRHIAALLSIVGVNVLTLHAQRQQRARLKAIDRFRGSQNGILIATDVAARGLDIPGVRTVVHYQLPHSAEVYVHRSGRTARASADGCSIALVSANETSKFASLCKSFSKESFQRFPVDNSYMPEVLKRLSLARQIDKILRKHSQEKASKTWFERNAELVELVVDNDDSEEERVNNYKQKKSGSIQLKKLQQELDMLLSHPLQPKSFSHRYLAGAGVSPLLQHQFEELAKQNNASVQNMGDNKRRKLAAFGQDLTEPLQALRTGGQQVHMDAKEMAEKRRKMENLRRKRKEEKKRLRDQRRNKRKQMKGKI